MIDKIRKRDGTVVAFDPVKIRNAILGAQSDVGRSDRELAERLTQEVVKELELTFPDSIPQVEQVQDIVEEKLIHAGEADVAKAYILYRQRHTEAREVKHLLGIHDDLKLGLNAATVLERRYLLRDQEGRLTETPLGMFARVAKAIAQVEANFGSEADVRQMTESFFEMLSRLEFLPNSPTLMNAGTPLGQLSACFVLPVPDSMEGIFTAIKNMALIHQSGGGTGFSFSRLRPKNDVVRSTGGVASGPGSFMRVFDMATDVIRQGGRRRGANMGILRVDHPDIREFITVKTTAQGFRNFNLSVAITGAFMDAVEKGLAYALINPRTDEKVGEYQARDIFDLIITSAWQCGDPGLVFIDRINEAHPLPQLGAIESTNPCGEQPLLPFESCNLGSINLLRMMKDSELDWQKLHDTVTLAVRFLDNVIDANRYPLPEIEAITRANRKIGLGVMGFADLLIRIGIPYASEEALKVGEKVLKFITETARRASVELAKKRGSFANFRGSRWEQEGLDALRNATVTTVAPTGTISIIAGVSSGIEPVFALSYFRRVMEGHRLLEEHPLFVEEMKKRGLYSRELMTQVARQGSVKNIGGLPADLKQRFACALDIAPRWHVRMQAAFQKYTDNAVSKTVNLPPHASQNDVREIYLLAYKLGCKGITVYRYGSREEQTLSFGSAAHTTVEGDYQARTSSSTDLLELDAEETGACRQCAT